MSDGDTLSGRIMRFNNPTASVFASGYPGRVAQLTRKTGFLMDCDVATFLTLHARCTAKQEKAIVNQVLAAANQLCKAGMYRLQPASDAESHDLQRLREIDSLMAKTRDLLGTSHTTEPETLNP